MVAIPHADALAAAVATKTFADVASTLAKKALERTGAPLRAFFETIERDFGPHMEATYLRCTKIKTILHRDEAVDLLSQYVPLSFESEKKIRDDFAVIEYVRSKNRAIIVGTAGAGKTIFMKYLWLSFFYNSEGRMRQDMTAMRRLLPKIEAKEVRRLKKIEKAFDLGSLRG